MYHFADHSTLLCCVPGFVHFLLASLVSYLLDPLVLLIPLHWVGIALVPTSEQNLQTSGNPDC